MSRAQALTKVDPILIEMRDGPEAAPLVKTLVEACPAVLRSAGKRWEIVVATDGDESHLLSDVLGHVQEWADRSDAGAVIIRFQGREYTFEATTGPRRDAAA